jgi:glucosamine-6-phosphate deaminase
MGRASIVVVDGYDDLSRTAAELVADRIAHRPNARIVAATGETPMGLYRRLAELRAGGRLDSAGVVVYQLDEYAGIGPDDRRSLLAWMMRAFLEPLGIPTERVVRLPIDGADLEDACARYERSVIDAGGYDLAILGIGENGHVGFNEPPADPASPTRVVELSASSIRSNARYWGGASHVPPRAVTVGMRLLVSTRAIVMVASGPRKREILRRTVEGAIDPLVPASYLRRSPELVIVADRAAWGDDVGPEEDPP